MVGGGDDTDSRICPSEDRASMMDNKSDHTAHPHKSNNDHGIVNDTDTDTDTDTGKNHTVTTYYDIAKGRICIARSIQKKKNNNNNDDTLMERQSLGSKVNYETTVVYLRSIDLSQQNVKGKKSKRRERKKEEIQPRTLLTRQNIGSTIFYLHPTSHPILSNTLSNIERECLEDSAIDT